MPQVELIYDRDCPNVQHARRALLEGFTEAGLDPSWTEWDRRLPASPVYVRQYGSPTILVDGRDIAGAEAVQRSDSCRVYQSAEGSLQGVPPVQDIASALGNAAGHPPARAAARDSSGWWFLTSLPGAGAALLPVGACPACWPAYAGILGSLGLGFLFNSAYVLGATIGFLGLALFGLAFRARTRRGYGPFILGLASVSWVLTFKFAFLSYPLVYAGLAGLVAASVWNVWPKKTDEKASSPRCA